MPPSQLWYCRLQNCTLYSSYMSSCYLLISMTFERFYSIIRPHKAASFNTIQKARIIIVCIFMLCFSYAIPYLFITGINGKLCTPNTVASDNGFGEFYYWLSEITLFVCPFISLLTMNCVIIHTLRKRSKLKLLETSNQSQSEVQNG